MRGGVLHDPVTHSMKAAEARSDGAAPDVGVPIFRGFVVTVEESIGILEQPLGLGGGSVLQDPHHPLLLGTRHLFGLLSLFLFSRPLLTRLLFRFLDFRMLSELKKLVVVLWGPKYPGPNYPYYGDLSIRDRTIRGPKYPGPKYPDRSIRTEVSGT